MKRVLLGAALMLLVVSHVRAQQAKPNFSGTWVLDLKSSDFGVPEATPESIVSVIDHKEPTVTIKTTQKGPQGEITNTRTITTDGKENTNTMRTMAGEQPVKSTTTWNGSLLATAFSVEIQGTKIDFNDSWDLSADGKVLTISRNVKSPQGDFSQKMVFNKQ